MDSQEQSEEAIFLACIQLPPKERGAFLESACGGDEQKRQSVESLIQAHETEDAFLDVVPELSIHFKEAKTVRISPHDERAGDRVGRYELIEPIGEGAWGTVWKAQQVEPIQREVALKILKLGLDSNEFLARFEDEQCVLAMLNYPNIATIFDAGTTERGRPFLVMELVRGQCLLEYADEKRLSLETRIQIFVSVCKAVQYAHGKGVIHRDLKPSNVLVKESPSEPIPKVIDFGIAKITQPRSPGHSDLTSAHSFIGTPYYSSPEQLEGRYADIDVRSDIYSLGALLYELISGRRYLDINDDTDQSSESIRILLIDALLTEPSSAFLKLSLEEREAISVKMSCARKKLERRLKGELDWIVMKCLEKDPQRRYQSALELADDLQAFLEHRPVSASAPGLVYRTRKFIKRHQFGSVVALVASLILVASFSLSSSINSKRFSESGESLPRLSESVVPEYRQVTFSGKAHSAEISPDGRFVAYMNRGSNDIIVHELETEKETIIQGENLIENPSEFKALWFHTWSPDSSDLLGSLTSNDQNRMIVISRSGSEVRELDTLSRSLAFPYVAWSSKDNRVYASYQNIETSGSWEVAFDPQSDYTAKYNRPPPEFANHHLMYINSSLADGKLLLVTHDHTDARDWHFWTMDVDGSNVRHVYQSSDWINSLAQQPNGETTYLVHGFGEQVALSKLSTSDSSDFKTLLVGQFANFSLSRDGKAAFTRGQHSSNLVIAEKDSNGEWREVSLTKGTRQHYTARLSPDGTRVAFSRSDGESSNIFVMDIKTREVERLTSFKESYSGSPAWSPNGQKIAFGSSEGEGTHVWIVNSDGTELRPYKSTNISGSLYVSWSPGSRILYQIPGNTSHRFLDPETGVESPMFEAHELFYGDSVKDPANPSVGWNFYPAISGDKAKIAINWNRQGRGLWIVEKGEDGGAPHQVKGVPARSTLYQHVDAVPYREKRIRLTFRAKANLQVNQRGYPLVRLRAFKSTPRGGSTDGVLYKHQFVSGAEWKDYSIEAALSKDAKVISVMVVVGGQSEYLCDDLQLAYESTEGNWERIEMRNSSFQEGPIGEVPVGWTLVKPNEHYKIVVSENSDLGIKDNILRVQGNPPVTNDNLESGYRPLRWFPDGEALYYLDNEVIWKYSVVDGSTLEYWRGPEDRNIAIRDISPDGRKVIYTEWENESDVWIVENFDPEFDSSSIESVPVSSVQAVKPVYEFPDPYADLRSSVAILPFESGNKNEPHQTWVNGLHGKLVNQIDKIQKIDTNDLSDLERFRNTDQDSKEVAVDLNVAMVLKGRVEGFSDATRIDLELFQGSTGELVWSESFNRRRDSGTLGVLQDELSLSIAETLEHRLLQFEIERARRASTQNFAAMENYFKGRESAKLDSLSELAQAATYFERAIGYDEDFALAYSALGEVLLKQVVVSGLSNVEQFEKAESVIMKALEIDETLGEAQAALNLLRFRQMVSEVESVRILGTLPIPVPEGGARGFVGRQFHAYPFEIPAGRDYLLANLEVACMGTEVPEFAIWTYNGSQPVVELVSFYSREEPKDTNLKFHPNTPITLKAGASYALVYKGKGIIQVFTDSLRTPTGVANILIDESEMVRKHSRYNQWVVKGLEEGRKTGRLLEGGEVELDKGYFSRAFGGFGFEIRGVPVPDGN